MSKIAQIFQKRSSPNKSASPDNSASLDRSTVNDTGTGTDPVLALKFKYFQDALGALNQQYGDIQKISTALDKRSYAEAQIKYKNLCGEIEAPTFPLEQEQKDSLLFGIYYGLAISDFRAGKFQEHKKHLLHAYKNYGLGRDESIIGLERWVEIYINLDQDVQTKVPSISEEYDTLLKEVKEDVQSLIKDKKYAEARAKIEYLNQNSHNFHIFDLYFDTIKKDTKEALKYFEDKSKNNLTQRQDIHNILKKWQIYLSKQVDDQEVAAKAATYASKYNPNPTVATASVKKAGKDVEKLQEQLDKANLKLKTVVTVDEQEKQIKEFTAKYEAELEKLRTEHKAELEALKPKDSPTKDTKVGEKTPTAPVVKPLEENVLKELTELANLITSVNHYEEQYKIDKDKAKSLLSKAVKENPDVYKTIDDPKILVLLADVLLSSNEIKEGRIVCQQALELNPNIWEATVEEVVLLNLAGVLLPSDQQKAKQIYSKVMNFRFICKNEQNKCVVDTNRKMEIAKIVAQDGYGDEERDCLAEFCLSSNKIHQQALALDCYPHTDVAKREAIAGQLKQLGKQAPNPGAGEYKAYALYTKAFSVLKDDQILRQDMKKAHNFSYLYTDPTHFPDPPTDESTAYILGECVYNNY
ncbi:hypothetical protein [Candidatus Tisiphia endosymbiont of Parasteatoda lunata]|uniref:hypothetical protein n=1 Tax=Candidatus Tisiphia endosymbiont of Parasteatoda lunata TaxID=3066275 RepID=UPI00313CF6B5